MYIFIIIAYAIETISRLEKVLLRVYQEIRDTL